MDIIHSEKAHKNFPGRLNFPFLASSYIQFNVFWKRTEEKGREVYDRSNLWAKRKEKKDCKGS